MPVKSIRDTITDTVGLRGTIHKDRSSGGRETTYIPYSNGAEVVMEKTAGPSEDGHLKAVRTVTKAKAPHSWTGTIPYHAGQFERIFKKAKE